MFGFEVACLHVFCWLFFDCVGGVWWDVGVAILAGGECISDCVC